MRAPKFWYRPRGIFSEILSPLGAIYAGATARRLAKGARISPGVPVICVGNINVGGTGKTPTVIALVERLKARGCAPVVLSRGYGGRIRGPHRVDPKTDSATDVGDEPLLLSAFAPVWVARDRAAGARAAAPEADVIILDDGFQNGGIAHDLSIVVVDAVRGFGNERILPAGPLREPVTTGLARADLLLSIGDATDQQRYAASHNPDPALPRLAGHLAPLETGMDWRDLRVLAFAGIGRPERFFATLRALGADLVETHALDDHQPLETALMRRLLAQAQAKGARLVTTEKDAVRLPQALRTEVLTLPVRLAIDDTSLLDDLLEIVLNAH